MLNLTDLMTTYMVYLPRVGYYISAY